MFWSRPHSVRMGLLVAIALSCLAVAPPVFAAPRGNSSRDRDRSARNAQDADKERPSRPTADERKPSETPRAAEPNRERRQGLLLRAVPSASPRDADRKGRDASPQVWRQPPQRTTPVSGQPAPNVYQTPLSRPDLSQPRSHQPSPVSQGKGWQRQPAERANPYNLYRAPEQKTAPVADQRTLRSQPAAPAADQRTLRSQPAAPAADKRTLRSQPATPVVQPRGRVDSTPPRSDDRQFSVPRADFRGPDAERDLKTVPRESQQRQQQRLQKWVQDNNRQSQRAKPVRPSRDIVGNPVPADSRLILRDKISRINIGYERVERTFGAPCYDYVITPRGPADYWDGYWDGYADGHWAGRHFGHHPAVTISFYYPYYWSDPYWVAFYYPGYYPGVYHYWGWVPGWVYPTRVYYVPVEYVYVPVTPYRYYPTAYTVDQGGSQRAIDEIRRAWFNSEITPLATHLTDRLDIRVYFDGEYEYTTSTEDYYAMTVDTMATTQTVAMDFNNPIWISSHEVFYTGRHVFYDPGGDRQTVYVSYRLRRLGTEWYVVAVGSSREPIRHQYRDFRYS